MIVCPYVKLLSTTMEIFVLLLLILPFILGFFTIKYFKSKKEIKVLSNQLQTGHDKFEAYQALSENDRQKIVLLKTKLSQCNEKFATYRDHCERERSELRPLRKYASIKDADEEVFRLRNKGKVLTEKAENTLKEAYQIARKIEEDANERAEQIAGDAWVAKANAEQYEASVVAMKNIIKGYGNEYLIPNHSLLDELADEYDHKKAGQDLISLRKLIKSMIKNNEAATCDYVEQFRKKTAIDFVLDAYNGKVNTVMAKVRHNNYGKLRQQLKDAYCLVNLNGKAFREARILPSYHEVMMHQLKLAVTVHELKVVDREEQKEIKAQMREEARATREYDKARKVAEKEEKMLQKAMIEARKHLEAASEEQKLKFEKQLSKLQGKLSEAELKNQRAMSMAQQTRKGHVYVISNIGSFGENIFKIGMTRRLEPMDRVKELGDASVPFSFDVHAMIHSEDAPKLEKVLHAKFSNNQVNKVNPRKEFFSLDLKDIKKEVDQLNIDDIHWTMKAEAQQYRESLAIG